MKMNLYNSKRILLIIILSIAIPFHILADDYYWIGGTGVWSDINHWATTSGGTVLHAQVPTANDNVYFDANSFDASGQIVTINLKNAVCKDFIWDNVSGNPVLDGSDTTNLRIFGSLKFVPTMQQDYQGMISFEAVSGQHTISTEGHVFNNNVIFDGFGGEWQFSDNFSCDAAVVYNHGTLKTNGKTLSTEKFNSESGELREIYLGSSKILAGSWVVDGNQLEMHAMSADFQISGFMLNKNGGPLHYPDVHITGSAGTITNENTRTVYRDLLFAGGGAVNGDCNIRDVMINGLGSITGSDSIKNVVIKGAGSINGGTHVIENVTFNSMGIITGNNTIGTVSCNTYGEINLLNTIDTVIIHGKGLIRGNNNIQYLKVTREVIIDSINSIYRADLLGDGIFHGDNNFHYFNCTPGFTYTFGINSTQTIENEWNIAGTCNDPIRILSDTNGVQAMVRVNSGSVQGEYLSLRDMKALGNTPFHAAHSVDLGNNQNWNIQTHNGVDLYWVNGSGNWSENNHWDTHSGGAGGHCPPTELDNAIFDAASFSAPGQEVAVDVENAVCKDMLWKNEVNAPVFSGTDINHLHVYGSLTEAPTLHWLLKGKIYFEAVIAGQTILTGNNPFLNDVLFTGRRGSWDFLDKFETHAAIKLQQGTINTLAHEVICYNFASIDTTTRGLHLETTKWTMKGGLMPVWYLNATNLTLTADSSLLVSEANLGNIISFGSDGPLVYHDVIFRGNGSQLVNQGVYCYYNVIDHYGRSGQFQGNCTIDSALFHNKYGLILDNDSINVAIFDSIYGEIRGGMHNVKKAIFKEDGTLRGQNVVDTAIFQKNGNILDTNNIDTLIVFNRALISGNNTIRTATLLGDGQFLGENSFHDLTLTKTRSYYLENSHTQTIYENLFAHGSCTGPIFIQSDENSLQATLKKVHGTIEVDYVQLRGINGEGPGIPFNAYHSVDIGNNSNWNIHTTSPKELYWVNGKGNWSDSLHWAGISGGQGGYCIPTPIDNVYFDENSFFDLNDTVTINIGNATCHNMNWTGAKYSPVFYSVDTNYLRIYGGLTLNPAMHLNLYCPIIFESMEGNNHIKSFSNTFQSDVIFQGMGGEWYLNDNFSSAHPVYFLYGSLFTQKNALTVKSFQSNYTGQRNLNMDSSFVTLTGEGTEVWFVNGLNMNFSSEGAVFKMTNGNAIFRTDYGGPFHYYKVIGKSISRIYNNNTSASYKKITLNSGGQINGNCTIDTVISHGNLSVSASDVIHYMHTDFGEMVLQGGNHKVNTFIADEVGTINGNNSLDSVFIGGRGSLSGTNRINKVIVFNGTASISGNNSIHYALLKNDGTINGENLFDSLKFSPGNIYQLEEGITQTVNKDFMIRGNNCFPITLKSQQDGQQAFISMPQERIVSGDFIEIKDINATGGATYYAGNYSTNLSNNDGWIFDNAPGYIFGFSSDTVVCSGDPQIIVTDNFNTDDNSAFLWQDGSTLPYYPLNGESQVWVTVTYASNCSYTDTLTIHYKDSPQVDLGDDQTLCAGVPLFINYHSDSVQYLWNDGSDDSIFVASQSGYASVKVTNSVGCSAVDSVFITVLPAPDVNLGPDTTIYSEEGYFLNAGNSGSDYLWSTGDTTQTITIHDEGEYWVSVQKEGCWGYDTIRISVYPDCILTVPSAFSPNGDGHNDRLFVHGEGFTEMELMIFNRIGELVFDTKDLRIGWDGTYKGKKQPVDAYMYLLKGLCVSGRSVMKKGNITLLR